MPMGWVYYRRGEMDKAYQWRMRSLEIGAGTDYYRRGIEENEPEGAGRVLASALVDGVADPGTPAAAGLDQLQVEALVVPGLLRHVGKASLGPHGRDAIR